MRFGMLILFLLVVSTLNSAFVSKDDSNKKADAIIGSWELVQELMVDSAYSGDSLVGVNKLDTTYSHVKSVCLNFKDDNTGESIDNGIYVDSSEASAVRVYRYASMSKRLVIIWSEYDIDSFECSIVDSVMKLSRSYRELACMAQWNNVRKYRTLIFHKQQACISRGKI